VMRLAGGRRRQPGRSFRGCGGCELP
jgi:hypothetical protein